QHRWDTKLSHPAVRFGDFYSPHRLWFVGSVQQLFSDLWPMLLQIVGELVNGDPVHSRATFITFDLPQCSLQVLSLTDLLHQSVGSSWAFGSTCRHRRFSLFSCDTSGCTRQRRREVQFHLDVLLLIVFETHGLLTAPSRSGLLRCRILCPMLTSAPRSGRLTATSVAEATRNRSPGVSSVTFRAQSPNLRFAPRWIMDFAVSCPPVRYGRLQFGFFSSTRRLAPCFLRTSPRGDSPCIITRPSPPSGRPEDFHLQVTEHAHHTTKPLARRTLPRR